MTSSNYAFLGKFRNSLTFLNKKERSCSEWSSIPPSFYQFFENNFGEYISRQNMTRGVGPHGFSHFWHVWNYIRPFWVTRRFLRAIKIATESWECVLSYQKVWSTSVDLLGNISIVFALAHVQISLLATLQKVMVEVYKVLYTRIRDTRLVYYRSGHL